MLQKDGLIDDWIGQCERLQGGVWILREFHYSDSNPYLTLLKEKIGGTNTYKSYNSRMYSEIFWTGSSWRGSFRWEGQDSCKGLARGSKPGMLHEWFDFLVLNPKNPSMSDCWWKKSCTTWDVQNPVNRGINYLSTGARFLPSTVGKGLHRSNAILRMGLEPSILF